MKRLLEVSTDDQDAMLGCGRILRFPGDGQIHEAWLDVMIYNAFQSDRGMGLLVISGHKAGYPLVVLPQESGVNAISVK
ncbi:MAG: Imm45 family immunity protein, partial [Rhizobiaceae bacterium]|nr:Imm45 family immunity protein [Rhizobiaceae bacterium]